MSQPLPYDDRDDGEPYTLDELSQGLEALASRLHQTEDHFGGALEKVSKAVLELRGQVAELLKKPTEKDTPPRSGADRPPGRDGTSSSTGRLAATQLRHTRRVRDLPMLASPATTALPTARTVTYPSAPLHDQLIDATFLTDRQVGDRQPANTLSKI